MSKIRFHNGSEIVTINTEEPIRGIVNKQEIENLVNSVSATNSSDYNFWKDYDWSWLVPWFSEQIREMKDKGYSEERIIEELKEFCVIKELNENLERRNYNDELCKR